MEVQNLRRALRWVEDVAEGKLVEKPGYHEHFLQFKQAISQRELDEICLILQLFMPTGRLSGVFNQAGELRPALKR